MTELVTYKNLQRAQLSLCMITRIKIICSIAVNFEYKGQLNVDQLYNYTNLRSNGLTEKLLQELNYFYNHFRWREDAESILGEIQHYPFLLHALAEAQFPGSKEVVKLNKSIKRSKSFVIVEEFGFSCG